MIMQIARVMLRNVRSYRAADVRLTTGTTLLSGDIGAGKTSLLYAIELALFGFAEVDPQYLVRHRARDADVSLTLVDGDRRWELRRRITRRSRKGRESFEATESSLAIDGQRAEYSATELRRWTIDLLGFPDDPNPRAHSDVWRWAVYLAQERMRDVLSPDGEARMDTIRKALGVEQFRLAAENARSVSRELRERADSYAEQASRHLGVEAEAERLTRNRDDALRGVARLAELERELRTRLEVARTEAIRMEAELRKLEQDRQALGYQTELVHELEQGLENERDAASAAHAKQARVEGDLERERAQGRHSDDAKPSMAELRAQRSDLELRLAELERLRGQAAEIDAQLLHWGARSRAIRAQVDSTRVELTSADADVRTVATTEPVESPRSLESRSSTELVASRRDLEEARRTLVAELASATSELDELESLVHGGICPRCHRPVDVTEFGQHQHEQEARVAHLREQLAQAGEGVDGIDRAIEARVAYERLQDRWTELEARRKEARHRAETVRERLAAEVRLQDEQRMEHDGLEASRAGLDARLVSEPGVRLELSRIDREVEAAEARARADVAREERIKALELQRSELQQEIPERDRRVADHETRLTDLRGQVAAEGTRLAAAAPLEPAGLAARSEVERLESAVDSTVREAVRPQTLAADAAARLEELARRQRERETLDRQGSELQSLAAWVDDTFRPAMLDLERRRLTEGRARFERLFGQYFAALVDDPALVARVDESFGPWVDVAGEATPAEALSGGERTALALAYRLALGRTVREAGHLRLDTLILDEPTEGFSQEQTLRMGDLLETMALPQVLLVSHEAQLEGIADRVLRVRKKDGVSTVEEGDQRTPNTPGTDEPVRASVASSPPRVPRRKIRRLTDLESPDAGPVQAR